MLCVQEFLLKRFQALNANDVKLACKIEEELQTNCNVFIDGTNNTWTCDTAALHGHTRGHDSETKVDLPRVHDLLTRREAAQRAGGHLVAQAAQDALAGMGVILHEQDASAAENEGFNNYDT